MFGEDEEGYQWSLNDEEDRESLLNLRDQFQPFQNIVSQVNSCSWEKVISEEQYFKGTLFRFPLRNEASEISDNLYDSTKVTQLFDSFIADADISLLFLRNVSSISLLHIDTDGLCNNRLKVSVSNNFITDLSHTKQESFDKKTCFKTVSHISQQMEEARTQWLVTTCLLKQGYIPEIDSLANKLSFYPQVDGAFQLDEDRSLCNGRLSCFLPLPNNEPNKTGLPIHINACFGLTDNRRFIKWQEEDQKNDESAMWNELLTKEFLPHVYLMMILDAIQLSENSVLASRMVYNLWPDLSHTVHKERWHEVATDTLKGLLACKIFHLADDEQIWVSASDAVFPVNNIHSDTMSAVSRLLIAEGEKLITVPEHVLKDVEVIFPEIDTFTWVTPSYVRNVLHRSEAENLSKDDKYTLLEFALSDEKYTELQGLKLLPLSDGTFTSFGSGVQNTVLIDNEKFSREVSKGGVSQSEAAEKCEEIFAKIQIICCKTLQTELLLNGNCLTTSSLLVLGRLLHCSSMDDVEKALAKYGIHNSGHKEEGHGSLPKPGCSIPEEWHDCLDMNFLNNFESGEYVGFSKDESGEYFYAIVIERVDDPLGQMRQFPSKFKIQVGSDDFIEVSSLDLYQFKREKKAAVSKESTCTDIERLLTSRPPPKTVFPETLEDIRREIDQSLNEIWKMSREDKQKALKRLYLRWHPDKNPDNEALATEAFRYLQRRIEELQRGTTTTANATASATDTTTTTAAHSTSSNCSDFRDFYNMWNTEAQSHRRGRERFYQNYSRRHYNFWSYHRETPRPNREEAKRWYEQAQCDIKSAHNDTGGDSSEWCLFKVHQAVEKALIAAIYRGSGQYPNNCSITSLAQQVSHFSSQLSSIPNTVRQLTDLGVDGKKTQYPNYHQFPHIPNKQFGIDNARRALDIATNLLEKIEEYIS
ncbi:hypothetical protein Q8A67_007146 [Cirrhinus molitorella]|uniref:HEPN domain-containing protein n=1 Tax=Cirrhinus molitorella TaxID=172907 RepID=A0AA88Q7R7_9TELE|nr:hypothetical protein Q8A67_007146 [Cirrhinus molitorella]